jgi:DNA polymerase III alpha subunit
MRLDNLGIPVYSEQDVEDMIYTGQLQQLGLLLVDIAQDDIDRFNQHAKDNNYIELSQYRPLDITQEEFDATLQSDWNMPDEYKQLDIEQWVIEQTPPWDPQSTRVSEELTAFKARNMLNLLRWMKYFVDTCRANNIVWGVGRGSSVASYVLYLIGVHKIDSIKYNLDWQEFLR